MPDAMIARAASAPRLPMTPPPPVPLRAERLRAWFGDQPVLRGVDLALPARCVTALIGPSGCGKTTLLRCLCRMHELRPGARLSGRVLLDGQDVYGPGVDAVRVRRRVGLVLQEPTLFPALSIRDNVLVGLTLQRQAPAQPEAVVEGCLRQAALWDEVKDRLACPGQSLSRGQRQRLCIARALALTPEVLLLDEPCAALDPSATARVEELLRDLRARYTIVLSTHNRQQAARVADYTAFLSMGEVIEHDLTSTLFTAPADPRTEDYLTGRFDAA